MATGSTLVINPADRMQVFLAFVGPVVLLFPFYISTSALPEIVIWIAVWILISRHNYILHNHVHRPFTRSRLLNRALNVLLGFCTGMTAGTWKVTHVHGHHAEDKLDLLPSRRYVRFFKVPEGERFSYFGAIKHALRTAPLQWVIPVLVMIERSFRGDRFRRKLYRFYLLDFLFVYGLVGMMFFVQPLKSILYFGLTYSLVYIISRHVDYITHVSSRGDARYGFANICTDPKYNRLLWNFGFHVAHHVAPRAHWTSLPSIHEGLGIEAAEVSAQTVNYFGFLSPWSFYWRRPRTIEGDQR